MLAGLGEWHRYPDPSPTGAVEETIAAVIDRGDPSRERQALVAAIRDGLPFAGESLIAWWKTRVAVYPEALRITMVKSHLGFGPHAWLTMLAERDDVLVLHGLLCQIGRSLISILLALDGNSVRTAGPKRMHQPIAQCTIAPKDLAHRMHSLLRADPHTAMIEAGLLINETLDLIDDHLPMVDTTSVRQRIAALFRGLPGSSTP